MTELITTAETAVEKKPSLLQLEVEIRFHLNQAGAHIIEVGKRLIQAKELVAHGAWKSWLEKNFNLGESSARKFMQVAERFSGKQELIPVLSTTQMIAMLALPEGEEEKFIEEEAAEGKPVEDMTVKALRAEIADYKARLEKAESDKQDQIALLEKMQKARDEVNLAEIERLEKIRASLIDTLNGTRKNIDKVIIEKNQLERQLKEKEKPEVVTVEIEKEVVPADYESTKAEVTELNKKLLASKDKIAESAEKLSQVQNVTNELKKSLADKSAELEKYQASYDDTQSKLEQANKTIEKLKKTNERLERKQYELAAEIPPDTYKLFAADIRDGLPEIADNSIDFIITDPPYPKEYIPLYGELSKVAARVLKDGGSLICMCGQSYLPEVIAELSRYMTYHWCMCYLTPGGQSPQLFQKHVNTFWKPLLWFVKGKYEKDWTGDVIKSATNDNDKRFHKWGQSVSGMVDVVERLTNPNAIILDPFVGGGATGVAAIIKGRKFIGVDLSKDCLTTTEDRIKEMYKIAASQKGTY